MSFVCVNVRMCGHAANLQSVKASAKCALESWVDSTGINESVTVAHYLALAPSTDVHPLSLSSSIALLVEH